MFNFLENQFFENFFFLYFFLFLFLDIFFFYFINFGISQIKWITGKVIESVGLTWGILTFRFLLFFRFILCFFRFNFFFYLLFFFSNFNFSNKFDLFICFDYDLFIFENLAGFFWYSEFILWATFWNNIRIQLFLHFFFEISNIFLWNLR